MNMQKILDALLEEGLRDGCYPGAAAAVGCRDQVFAISHVGKISENGPAVDEATRYDMASLSKVLGPTMIALKAIEEGKLTLWDRLERFFPYAPEDKKEITILHLMTHTAGFAPAFWLSEVCDTPEDALKAILDRPLDTPVGKEVHYSCMGYIILGKVLETLYGKPLNELADERVFKPLGMIHTAYCPTGGNIAATEVDKETGIAWQGIVHDENARFLRGVSANAGVFSDIHDMICFAQMLAKGGEGYLSGATLKKAIRCHAQSVDARRGLGFHLAGTPENFMGDLVPETAFGHTGFTGTSLVIEPESGFYAILLSNRVHPTRESTALFRFRRRMHNALYAEVIRMEKY
ncbi:MAG: beta-lactamase family protein [Clostridia bacterium]|nr:beta-lactamase family protein [Clostridia bacterium]